MEAVVRALMPHCSSSDAGKSTAGLDMRNGTTNNPMEGEMGFIHIFIILEYRKNIHNITPT